MTPKINEQIKCIFRNGLVIKGIVEYWDIYAKLKSLDGKSILIIQRPVDDIMLIEIMIEPQTSQLQKIADVIPSSPFNPEHNKKLAELKKELIEQDKNIIANKLRNHSPSTFTKVNYEQPRFSKKQGSE